MKAASIKGGVTQFIDYMAMKQNDYCKEYHASKEKGETLAERTCERSDKNHSCEGKETDKNSFYWKQAPFNNRMDGYGEKPGLGFVTGLGRLVVGVLEIGVGAIGVLAGYVHTLAAKFIYFEPKDEDQTPKDLTPYVDKFQKVFEAGRDNFWNAPKEIFSFGCHTIIAEKYEKLDGEGKLNAWKQKAYALYDAVCSYLPKGSSEAKPSKV